LLGNQKCCFGPKVWRTSIIEAKAKKNIIYKWDRNYWRTLMKATVLAESSGFLLFEVSPCSAAFFLVISVLQLLHCSC
jgi:hypothetical protein